MTRKRWFWVLPLLFLGICGGPSSSAEEPRNTVRERERATPTAGARAAAVPVEEVIIELDPLEEVVVAGCQDSLNECTSTQASECANRHPLPPGSRAAQFNRVTKYEEGRACEFICYDKNGEPHSYGCVKQPAKPKPKPEDQTLTPGDGVRVLADGRWLMPCKATPETMRCPFGVTCLYRRVQDGPDGFPSSTATPECAVDEGHTIVPIIP